MRLTNRHIARWASVVIIAILSLFAVLSASSSAQEPAETISLGISPQILDVTANPGESLQNTFRLTNASPASVDIQTTPKNFTPRGEEGAVDLTVDDTSFSLSDWVSVSPERTVIEPGQTTDFAVSIAVPANAEPGSHFGSVVFQTIPPEDATADALVSQEIAPVILVKIAGDTTETAEIEEFTTDQNSYGSNPTVQLISRIKNTGNVHFKPTGKITIKNMWGSEIAELELDRRNVLPDSIRQITTEWQPDGFQIGRYTATLTLVYGESDEIRVEETSFTIFPWEIIVPVIAGAVVVSFVVIRYRKRFVMAAKVLSGKQDTNSTSKDTKE